MSGHANAVQSLRPPRRYRLGFDIGGTFTDFVLIDRSTGALKLAKCLTTPHDPSEGVAQGLQELLHGTGITGADLEIAVHATTLITNSLIERKGYRTALLTTAGFRDTLEMGTELRYDNYDLSMQMPRPLVERNMRFDITERMDSSGAVVRALDEDQVRAVAGALRQAGVKAVAVAFLHAYRNPEHERRTAAILAEELPEAAVSLSSVVSPEIREYERTSTTVANAYVQPIVRDYLDKAIQTLARQGYRRPLHMMISSGGVSDSETVKKLPLRMLESGPSAGVLSAIHFGRLMGLPDLITFDMGGTTAKIGVVRKHEARKSNLFEVGRVARFMKGSGLPIRIPHIELIEIGAGGGSIAHVDRLGLLAVGPQSVGSAPGPACYGLGGTLPTVTDANVVLGYLNPGYFLGGAMPLDAAAAQTALERSIGGRLGLDAQACAAGVYEVVNQNMIAASKVHIAERGEDPRSFYLFSFGGAGPSHAYELARALHMKGVVVPPGAGAASATGLVASPVSFDLAQSVSTRLAQADWSRIREVFDDMEREGRRILQDAGAEAAGVRRFMDLRHYGQGREVTVEVDPERFAQADPSVIAALFYEAHFERYGHAHRNLPVELVTCRTTVTGPDIDMPLLQPRQTAASDASALKGTRPVYFPELKAYVQTPVYERARLAAGTSFAGPAVIEERECTTVAGPSARVRIDELGAIYLELRQFPCPPAQRG